MANHVPTTTKEAIMLAHPEAEIVDGLDYEFAVRVKVAPETGGQGMTQWWECDSIMDVLDRIDWIEEHR